MLAGFAVNGEQRHFGVIHPHEHNFFTVRAPPEGAVAGRSAQDFFEVYPARIAIQNKVSAVTGYPVFFSRRDMDAVQIIFSGKGHPLLIWREGGIDFSFFRLSQPFGVLTSYIEVNVVSPDGYCCGRRSLLFK